jgi:hypothetical protein
MMQKQKMKQLAEDEVGVGGEAGKAGNSGISRAETENASSMNIVRETSNA